MAARFLTAVAVLALVSSSVSAQTASVPLSQPLQFEAVPFSVVLNSVLRRVLDKPFVICDEALKDDRRVSLRLDPYQLNMRTLAGVFRAYGYSVRTSDGVTFVCNDARPSAELPFTGGQSSAPARPIAQTGPATSLESGPRPVPAHVAPASFVPAVETVASGIHAAIGLLSVLGRHP